MSRSPRRSSAKPPGPAGRSNLASPSNPASPSHAEPSDLTAPTDAAPDRVDRIQAEWRRERPDLDVSPQGVIGRLHRLAAALTTELVAVYAEHGLTEGDFDVLASLRRAGAPYARRPAELARATMVTTGGLSKRIDRLEAAGLVRRGGGVDGDARSTLVHLTDDGRATIDRAFEAHMANEARLLGSLTTEDRATLEALLRRWLGAVSPDP